MSTEADKLDEAIATNTGAGVFQTSISTAGVTILGDEPISAGGLGTGPTPYQLLASALASCTTMTMKLYADRKGWQVSHILTAVGHHREPGSTPTDVFSRRIEIDGDLDDAQRTRLLAIADQCPVHKTLTGGARVETQLGKNPPEARVATDHVVDMEALIAVGRGSFDFVE